MVAKWEVTDKETLSNHRLIVFEIQVDGNGRQKELEEKLPFVPQD